MVRNLASVRRVNLAVCLILFSCAKPPFSLDPVVNRHLLLYCMREDLLYVTDRGNLVKASDTVSVGDEVFVARGCSCALILRHASEAKASQATSEAARANL